MRQIDYYFSLLSPWAYLAGERLEKIAETHGVTVNYKPIDITALFPRSGGQPLPERHPSRQEYRLQELKRWSAALDMPLNLQPAFWPANAAPASYAIIAAQNAGGDTGALVQSLLRACWAEEKNIAEDDVIEDSLTRAGFDPGLADSGLFTGADVYGRNLEDAVAAGVFGSPFYIVDGSEKFWGQDRLDALANYLSDDS